ARADGDAVARPRFTSAHPDRLRIIGIDFHRANRKAGLLIKHRFESSAGITRLPQSASRRSYINRKSLVDDSLNVGNASSHHSGSDGACFVAAKSVGINLGLLRKQRNRKTKH